MKADVDPVEAPNDGKQDPRKTMIRSSIEASLIFFLPKTHVYERAKSGHLRIFMPN
ncbi:hypothetical protein KXR63_03985 [Stutzerimonas chloritidismutans]|mgnify:CR=1 FL=1|jgi:hypothetical protein|uniref:hypothetical protein n=1 Tax=Stutzerimonas chloritidismutans TaxID=203192 RepID=UPI003F145CA2